MMVRPLIIVCGMAFEARIARGHTCLDPRENIAVVHAARADKLTALLNDALKRGASGILSFGTAGGLAPDLMPGTLIMADAVHGPDGRLAATNADWSARLVNALASSPIAANVRQGTLASVTAPVASAQEKAALFRETNALAVDMESHLAAAAAAAHGLPFAVCRAIVDPAQRSLPTAALAGLRDDGTTSVWPVLRELARHPGQLRALLQVAADARAARAALVNARCALAFVRP
jgi:hopanoid-associated phosphorylase